MLYSIVALLAVILDQAVKFWVTDHLLGYDEITLIPGLINMVDVPNDGAAFGILSGGNARIGFIIVTVIFCLAVIIALATNFINGRLARWSLVMVAAGGFANCIDRVMYGYVVDMFKTVPFPDFPIFNVADIFITVFCIIFALAIIFEKDKVDKDDDEDDDYEEDEEEIEEPKPRKGKRRRKDEDDEEEELVEKRPAKLSKKAKAEAEYEEYKAAQNQRLGRKAAATAAEAPIEAPQQTVRQSAAQAASVPAQTSTRSRTVSRPVFSSDQLDNDPFAEWEQANAKVDAKRSSSYAAQAMDSGVNTNQSRSVYHAPVQQPVQSTIQQPVQQNPQSVAAPAAPVAKPKSGSDEFDLDSILNEFK